MRSMKPSAGGSVPNDSQQSNHRPATVNWAAVRPQLSATVLQCISKDTTAAYSQLVAFLTKDRSGLIVNQNGWTADDDPPDEISTVMARLGVDAVDSFIWRETKGPRWAPESDLTDVESHLTVALLSGQLVAVQTNGSVIKERLTRWVHQGGKGRWRLIPVEVSMSCLADGSLKGINMQGTHRRRSNKPDSQSLGGIRLQDSLDPTRDSSYAFRSGRSKLPDDPQRTALRGTIGMTPRKSSIWSCGPTSDFSTFITSVAEAFGFIEKHLAETQPSLGELAMLAREVEDPDEVHGAYEVSVLAPEDLPQEPAPDDDLLAAAALLQRAVFMPPVADPAGPGFTVEVGLDGATGGSLSFRPVAEGNGVRLRIGIVGAASDMTRVRPIIEALRNGDLMNVYYRSGHALTNGQFHQEHTMPFPFRNWRFRDFTGYLIDREKPIPTASDQVIHDAIGVPGDLSLFAWVVHHYSDGWLVCDDGAEEVADFVHLANDGTLTLIHVKSANGRGPRRHVSATAYEQVASQAVKNMPFTNLEQLSARLMKPRVSRPACWTDGKRVTDRSEFLDMLSICDDTCRKEVVIVQPHVSEATCRRVHAASTGSRPTGDDGWRLRRLDSLLNAAQTAVVGRCDNLTVIGSQT